MNKNMFAICTFEKPISGWVRFKQTDVSSPVEISFDLRGFDPYAVRAVHIHEYGDLSEGCKSLGTHYNPTRANHGQHAGDLFYNLQADENGEFRYRYRTSAFAIGEIVGRSVVIHSFRDDLGMKGWTNPDTGEWFSYRALATDQLRSLVQMLYGLKMTDRYQLLQKLESESVTTGNASVRLACAIIGWAKK